MTTQTFHGSCHCGRVRFACDLDPSLPTSRCNCSICTKLRLWKAFVPGAALRLLEGADELSQYRFNSGRVEHAFCRNCGIKPFGHGPKGAFPDEFWAVNIACLDDMDDATKGALPVVWQDGRHDDWEHAPAQVASL